MMVLLMRIGSRCNSSLPFPSIYELEQRVFGGLDSSIGTGSSIGLERIAGLDICLSLNITRWVSLNMKCFCLCLLVHE
jgi:hypothetical protein